MSITCPDGKNVVCSGGTEGCFNNSPTHCKTEPKPTPSFAEWVEGGKQLPVGMMFTGGSPFYDESAGKNRTDEAVYAMIYGSGGSGGLTCPSTAVEIDFEMTLNGITKATFDAAAQAKVIQVMADKAGVAADHVKISNIADVVDDAGASRQRALADAAVAGSITFDVAITTTTTDASGVTRKADQLSTADFNSAMPGVKVSHTNTHAKDNSVLASRKSTLAISENPCNATQPKGLKKAVPGLGDYNFDNRACFEAGVDAQAGVDVTTGKLTAGIFEQAAGDVTKGYQGKYETTVQPINKRYVGTNLCPVNVHWHLGAEHRSAGQYDETGTGPEHKDGDIHRRRKLAGKVRQGNQCKLYNKDDAKFTKPYNWQYCKDMEVGQTYEVHWPHSALGACGTPHQYQYPFYDGVFCKLTDFFAGGGKLSPQAIASTVGVQGQVFTIVNDEQYYYDNLIAGMIVDGDFGKDMAVYTGSTTGTSRDNKICSMYAPITWQVDRACHVISASSFDKMCADMQAQQDNMAGDTHPHGSRHTVLPQLAANNQKTLGTDTLNGAPALGELAM